MKSLTALILALVAIFGMTVPAEATDGVPSPTPKGIVRCESGQGVVTTPSSHSLRIKSWEHDDWIDATPAIGGKPVGDDWRNGMSGFAFDGQIDSDNPVGAFIWGHFRIQYRLPIAACDRLVFWRTDLRLVLPEGVRTLGDPDNHVWFRSATFSDPDGDFNVTSAFENLGWRTEAEYHQAHGLVEHTGQLSGGMIVPAGEAANVFVFFSVQLTSYQGSYCIGPCVEQRPSALGQDGYFELTAPSDPSGETAGIAFSAYRHD